MADLTDDRDADAQRYADRLLQDSDWRLPDIVGTCYRGYLRPDQLRAELRRAFDGRVPTTYTPRGPMLFCYDNVQRQVAAEGGEMVLGWQIMPHMRWDEGVHLEAHAVWRSPDGRLLEVTVGRPTWEFAPCAAFEVGAQIVITTSSSDRAKRLTRHAEANWARTWNPLAP